MNIRPFTKPVYKRLHLIRENKKKLLTGTELFNCRSLINLQIFIECHYVPEAAIGLGIQSPLEKDHKSGTWTRAIGGAWWGRSQSRA